MHAQVGTADFLAIAVVQLTVRNLIRSCWKAMPSDSRFKPLEVSKMAPAPADPPKTVMANPKANAENPILFISQRSEFKLNYQNNSTRYNAKSAQKQVNK
jgi:hypothetical protein